MVWPPPSPAANIAVRAGTQEAGQTGQLTLTRYFEIRRIDERMRSNRCLTQRLVNAAMRAGAGRFSMEAQRRAPMGTSAPANSMRSAAVPSIFNGESF